MFTCYHVAALTGPKLSKPWCRATCFASSWPTDRLNRTRNELVKTSEDDVAAIRTVTAKHCNHMLALWPAEAD